MQQMIVIGAGILGASTAYHLAKAGFKVTVIDRQDAGQATEAAAGIVCPWLSQRRNKAWYQLAKGGAKYYQQLIPALEAETDQDTGYKKVGAISLHHDETKLEKMIDRAIKRREDAPEIGEIKNYNQEETRDAFPPLSQDFQSVYVSGAARVDGRKLRKALLKAAELYGADIIHGEAFLVSENGQLEGVKVNGELLHADKIIVTAGVWARELLEPIGLNFQVSAQKAQIVHLHVPDTDTSEWSVVQSPTNHYLLSFEDGKVVVGATHEDEHPFNTNVTAGGVLEVLSKALTVAPGLQAATLVETKVGFRPYTPGFLPVIGQVPGYEKLYAANGLGASGLTSGPYLGAQLAKLVSGEELDIDIALYNIKDAFR
ncbi:NAD(P)/FAD-dependent oxidoreductase [Cytobacillus sp. FSL R7-0680]|uniref:NAD(P)/FAD-dependent oxidoreductase n=1 Tax=Cytobacillus sp. FSL R7-0680 TaxID=2921689 RepID=UPI0030FB59F9